MTEANSAGLWTKKTYKWKYPRGLRQKLEAISKKVDLKTGFQIIKVELLFEQLEQIKKKDRDYMLVLKLLIDVKVL